MAEGLNGKPKPARRIRVLAVAIGLAAGIGIGISCTIAVFAIRASRAELAQAWQAHAIYDQVNALAGAVTGVELEQRSVALFHQPFDQARLQGALAATRRIIGGLDATARQHTWLQPHIRLLALLAETRLNLLSLPVPDARLQPPIPLPPAPLPARAATDRATRLAFTAAISQTTGAAMARERQHLQAFRQNEQSGLAAILIAAAIAVGLLTLALLGGLASRRRLLAVEQTLRREGERLAAMINHIRDGVAVFDREDRLVLCNSAFLPGSGLPAELAAAGTPFAAFTAAATDWFPPLLDEPRPHGEPIVAEVQRQGRVLEVWRSALPDGGQILAIADISKRVEAEQMARQAQRMDALGQLTGGIAHDMNNLLQVISANLEQLHSRLPQEGSLGRRLDAAMTGVARGANLTRHLLAFARRQPLSTEVIEPGELIRGTADLLRRALGETYEVRLAIDERESLWAIRTDPQQLENAVLNLALNARDAMPGGGRLVIIVTNRTLDDEYAAHHAEVTPGQYVMIAVADTGHGMSPEQIAHAADPFYTTKGGGRGTGLGLSMVYGLTRQSGGHFRIDSSPGEGTTVRLYLPRTHAPLTEAQRHPLPPSAAGELVLVVEDDQAVRAVAVGTLIDLGYRTLEAENANAAMALLNHGARPDVLFTDMVMPGTIGVAELVRSARRMLPGLAVLFTTGYTNTPELSAAALGPPARLLPKPWTRVQLADAVHEAIEGAAADRLRLVPHPGLRILLVEDEVMVRETTAELIEAAGHTVLAAASAAEARAIADDADLVMTDAGLPDADGVDFAEELLARQPDLPIIVVSGRAPDPAADPGLVWLSKPFDLVRLRQAIADAISEARTPRPRKGAPPGPTPIQSRSA
ncbi:MAG: response regulator [Acetobacteraceae bacterium]